MLVTGVADGAPARFGDQVLDVVEGEIYPALARLRQTISERVLPRLTRVLGQDGAPRKILFLGDLVRILPCQLQCNT